jgi:hypothetical protein
MAPSAAISMITIASRLIQRTNPDADDDRLSDRLQRQLGIR